MALIVNHILRWLGELYLVNIIIRRDTFIVKYLLIAEYLSFWCELVRCLWNNFTQYVSVIYLVCDPYHLKVKGLAIGLNDRWP